MPGAGAGAGAAEKFYSEPEPEPELEYFPGAGAGAGADQTCHGSASLVLTGTEHIRSRMKACILQGIGINKIYLLVTEIVGNLFVMCKSVYLIYSNS